MNRRNITKTLTIFSSNVVYSVLVALVVLGVLAVFIWSFVVSGNLLIVSEPMVSQSPGGSPCKRLNVESMFSVEACECPPDTLARRAPFPETSRPDYMLLEACVTDDGVVHGPALMYRSEDGAYALCRYEQSVLADDEAPDACPERASFDGQRP